MKMREITLTLLREKKNYTKDINHSFKKQHQNTYQTYLYKS